MASPSFFAPEGTNATRFTQDSKGLELTDTLQGLAQKNARTWQIIALASLSSFFISLGLLVYTINLPKTVPVIVTVNPEGQANYVGRVDRSLYGNTSIPEIAKEYQIKTLINKMHTWVIDRQAQQMYITETSAIVQLGAIKQLDTFYRSDNPYSHLAKLTRSVQFETLLKQTDQTYIGYFRTIERSINGSELKNQRWSVLINIQLFEPTINNPLGIFITNFDIKQIEENQK
jgi:type IV secretory pathway TrbF-like protein